jgi:hypothetical protein
MLLIPSLVLLLGAPISVMAAAAPTGRTSPARALTGASRLRRPEGVYVKVDLTDYATAHPGADFGQLYAQLLHNPAIQGLTLQIHWGFIQPSPGTPKWQYIGEALSAAAKAGKTVQLIVTPGFNSPAWVLHRIQTADGSCDSWFDKYSDLGDPGKLPSGTPPIPQNCGTVTFAGYNESADGAVLPLPWNGLYKELWAKFLKGLARQFGNDKSLVSISIAGPTAASAEMILPADGNTSIQSTGWTADGMWNALLGAHYDHAPTDQFGDGAFIAEWRDAIKLYEGAFKDLTLVATPGDGQGFPAPLGETQKPASTLRQVLCSHADNMSCAAVARILADFESFPAENGNGKATQVSGMGSTGYTLRDNDAGIGGVKYLAWQTAVDPSSRIGGGGQFDKPVCPPAQGQPGPCATPVPPKPQVSPEQEAYDVLATFFNGTKAAPLFFSRFKGESLDNPPEDAPAPIDYLEIYYQDEQYAADNVKSWVDTRGGSCSGAGPECFSWSLQELFCESSYLLAKVTDEAPTECLLPGA